MTRLRISTGSVVAEITADGDVVCTWWSSSERDRDLDSMIDAAQSHAQRTGDEVGVAIEARARQMPNWIVEVV